MQPSVLARSGLSLDRLASFLAVVDAGGIAAAAARDPVRQSQFSRQLKELEEYFGCTLLERRRGVFRLTSAGHELRDLARETLARLGDFERRCSAQPMEIHLGAGEGILVWLLLPRLKAVLGDNSRFVLTLHNLRSEDILTRLREGRLDFGILRRAVVPAALRSATLPPVDYALFVSRATVPKGSPESAAELLSRMPLACLEGNSELNQALADLAADQGTPIKVRLWCTSLPQVAEAVRHLGLAAVLPVWAGSAFAAGEVLKLDLPILKPLRTPLRLAWSKRREATRPEIARIAPVIVQQLMRDQVTGY
jgi:DNA-binding transcriptional LysR family regulator